MDIHLEKRNEKLAETVIKGLKSRNMSGYYAKNKEEALKLVRSHPEEQQHFHGRLYECAGNRTGFRFRTGRV